MDSKETKNTSESSCDVLGIRFQTGGKIYQYLAGHYTVAVDDWVVANTARGVECGQVATVRHNVSVTSLPPQIKTITRPFTQEDYKTYENNRTREKKAFSFCQERIAARHLKMNLVDVECMFDNNKLLFYFTAENRVDFRDLVKDLAATFHTRIELRQIGVRDKARILGGLGICGREFCCKSYLHEFQPVSIRMAKIQGLSLNPTKISGCCGRLMCCLKYEQNVYEEFLKVTPKVGAIVALPDDKKAQVTEINVLTGDLKVIPEGDDVPIKTTRDDVTLIHDAKIKIDPAERRALKELEE